MIFKSRLRKILRLRQIGIVRNNFIEPTDPLEIRKHESLIILDQDFQEGLHKIEDNEYIQVIFYFHQVYDYTLKDRSYDGIERGIFASRSSQRPNNIGLTKVKLLEKEGEKLRVIGLDALDGSPVLDIKPYSEIID